MKYFKLLVVVIILVVIFPVMSNSQMGNAKRKCVEKNVKKIEIEFGYKKPEGFESISKWILEGDEGPVSEIPYVG